jgi:hypothetical protein
LLLLFDLLLSLPLELVDPPWAVSGRSDDEPELDPDEALGLDPLG